MVGLGGQYSNSTVEVFWWVGKTQTEPLSSLDLDLPAARVGDWATSTWRVCLSVALSPLAGPHREEGRLWGQFQVCRLTQTLCIMGLKEVTVVVDGSFLSLNKLNK